MGNKINVKHTEETETLKVTEKLIRDFQYHINLVDRSIVGFARSIDSMRASCAVFKRDTKDAGGVVVGSGKTLHGGPKVGFLALKDKQQEQVTIEEKHKLEENLKQHREIIDDMRAEIESLKETIDDVVSDHKFIAFETLSRFFAFIIDNGSGFFTSESETILSVEKYRHQNSSDADLNLQYYDTRIELLQNKIKTLNTDYQSAKEDIEMFNERDFLYFEEKKILREKVEVLEKGSAEIKLELKKRSNAEFAIKQSNEEMKNKIKSLKWSEKKVLSQKEEKASEVKTLTENINILNAELNDFKQRHKEKTNEMTECLQQEEKAKEEIIKELHDFKEEIKQRTDEEKKDFIKKVSSLEIEIKQLTADVKEKQIEVKVLEEKHKSEINAILKERSKLQQDLKEKEAKAEEMETRLESLQEVKAKSSLIETNLSAFTSSMNDEIKTMKSNLKDNHTLVECLKLEKATQEQSMKQLEELKSVIQQQKEEIQEHADKVIGLTECLQQERTGKEETMKELHDFKDMNQRTEQKRKDEIWKVSALEIEIQQLTAYVKEKQIEAELLEETRKSEMDAILKERSKLQQDLKEKEAKAKEMEIRLESLQEVIAKSSLIETNLSAFTTSMNDEIKTMNSNLKDNHSLVECLKLEKTTQEQSMKQLEELKSLIQQQKEEIQEHADKVIGLTECLQQERKVKEETMKELHDFKDMNQRTEEERKDVIGKVSALEIEIQQLTAYVKEKQIEAELLEETRKSEMDAILKERSKLQQDLKEKEAKAKEMEIRLESLQEVKAKSSLIETKLSAFTTSIESLQEVKAKSSMIETKLFGLMTSMNDEIKTMNTNLKENHSLTNCLEHERKTNREYLKRLEDLKVVQQQQKVEITSVGADCSRLERENTTLTADLMASQKEIESLETQQKQETETCIQTIENLKQKQEEQREIIKEQANKIELDLTSNMKNEADTRASAMESRKAAITSLEEDIEKMSKESAEIKLLYEEDKRILVESLKKERNEKDDWLKQLNDLKEKFSRNDDIIRNLNDENKRLTTVIEEKDNEIKSLQIKLQLASRKVISVQVCHYDGFHSTKAEVELQNMLKTKMATELIDLQFLNCSESFIVQSHLPFFIVCSRNYCYKRDKNIAMVIKGLKGTQKKAALLMFHDRAVKDFQTEVDNTKDNTEKIGGIFDIGHKNTIFECDTNSRNIEQIIQFLKREGLQKSKDMESVV